MMLNVCFYFIYKKQGRTGIVFLASGKVIFVIFFSVVLFMIIILI